MVHKVTYKPLRRARTSPQVPGIEVVVAHLNLLGPQHAAAPNVPSRANLPSCGDVRRRRGGRGSGRAASSAGEVASIDAFFRRRELLGLTAVRPYGRTAVFRAGRRARRNRRPP